MLRPLGVLPVAALLFAGPALAQGTAEQREACTPDAVKLCSDTIPDIPKTTACMERHRAELTPRCRAAMAPETAPPSPRAAEAPSPPRKRVARETPDADHPPPHETERPRRRASRELRPDDDAPPRMRRGGRDDGSDRDGPDRDGPDRDGPERFGYGPRGDAGGPPDGPDGYGPPDEGPDGPRGYGPPDPDGRRADRDDGPPPGYVPPGARRYRYLAPNGDPAMTPEGGARARARAEIGRLCDDEMLDPRTCAETDRALRR